MFAKLQKNRTAACDAVKRNAATATPCNDNTAVRRGAVQPHRARRPALLCRWYRTPAGGLACGWHVAGAEDPQIALPAGRRVSRATGRAAAAALLLL